MTQGELITAPGWQLFYTIGDAIAAPVRVGDLIELPPGRSMNDMPVKVIGGKPPRGFGWHNTGTVQIADGATIDGLGANPSALGCKWIRS